MTSTNPFYDFDSQVYFIRVKYPEYRPPKNRPTVAEKKRAAKESQREFLRRKKK